MPKRLKGTNSKSEEARARRDAAKAGARVQKEKEEEDSYWRQFEDRDVDVHKKQQRKADRTQKRQEVVSRKKESAALLAEEESQLKGKQRVEKVTQSDIARAQLSAQSPKERTCATVSPVPLEENPNLAVAEYLAAEGAIEARSVEDAITVLRTKEPELERHPERRLKAAYAAFEERNLPKLKAENPTLRMSQLKQVLKKDWLKSPENPMNQVHQAFNTKPE